MKRVLLGLGSVLGLAALVLAGLLVRELVGGADTAAPPPGAAAEQISRGAYLARIGNCHGCHTAPGGEPYAGGLALPTPFGAVMASNLTPDPVHGIGLWSAAAFWRALHEGRSREGRLLYPAFPYTHTTHLTRTDSDDLLAYLRSLAPVAQANRAHTLRFPYSTQLALAAWRMLYFKPADPAQPLPLDGLRPTGASAAELARGAYLVHGLGHCGACHAPRNALGATTDALSLDGGLMPAQHWLAPSLRSPQAAGVADWPLAEVVALLTTGQAPHASVQGPMAEVVHSATQYLSAVDARAMALYLMAQPAPPPPEPPAEDPAVADAGALRSQGARLYRDHCVGCHGDEGEGVPGAYPALAGNRALLLGPPVNLVQLIVHGGFAPATAGNPRPYGMPPFGLVLSNQDIAALLSHLRHAWGHKAPAVSPLAVQRWRESVPR